MPLVQMVPVGHLQRSRQFAVPHIHALQLAHDGGTPWLGPGQCGAHQTRDI